jgi:3-methyladenine DNA glycosylase AlkC
MPTADELIGTSTVRALARCLRTADPSREWNSVRASANALAGLGFGERGQAVAAALVADFPASYGGTDTLVRTALRDPAFSGWMIMPVAEAVARRAIASRRDADFERGLRLLAALTPRLTAEFALRSFLAADVDRTLATVVEWTGAADAHVRRLASEGTRPRLPWAKRVPALLARPETTVPIVDRLYRDGEEYVRRSVANHLNDISRMSPDLAVGIARRWLAEPSDSTPRLIRHAMRTLIKGANADALTLVGFPPLPQALSSTLRVDETSVRAGHELAFECVVVNTSADAVRIAIDYVLHFQKANGILAPKIFKLTTRTLAPGERLTVVKRHSFRPITTRVYHLGAHAIELQINGARANFTPFDLVA